MDRSPLCQHSMGESREEKPKKPKSNICRDAVMAEEVLRTSDVSTNVSRAVFPTAWSTESSYMRF